MGNPDGAGGRQRIKSVETAFDILESLKREGGATVSTIAAESDLARSTVYVYLNTLESEGYVHKQGTSYHLGTRFLTLGCIARGRLNIYQAAKGQIEDVAARTGELVSLGIEDDGYRAVLYRAEGANAVHDRAPTGEYTHMHWSSLGKALLASLPVERVEAIVERHGLPRATENTITDRERLFESLGRIADRGYAIEDEEREPGIRSIATPIVCDGQVRGAIAIAGPKHRFTPGYVEETLYEELRRAVNVVELRYKHY